MSTKRLPSFNALEVQTTKWQRELLTKRRKVGHVITSHSCTLGIVPISCYIFYIASYMERKATLNNQHHRNCVLCYMATFIDSLIPLCLFFKTIWYTITCIAKGHECNWAVSFLQRQLQYSPSDPISLSIFIDTDSLHLMQDTFCTFTFYACMKNHYPSYDKYQSLVSLNCCTS